MKKHFFLLFFITLPFLCSAKPQKEKPVWVDNLAALYSDSFYIAKIGKAVGAKASLEAQAQADQNIAEFLRAGIKSTTSSKRSFTTQSAEGNLQTTEVRENLQEINIYVDLTLSGLSHTDPWYNKKEKTWYSCAYVNRKKAYEAYKPTIQDECNKFLALYQKAEDEKEPLLKCNYYKTAFNSSGDFRAAYDFGILLNPSAVKTDFEENRNLLNSIPASVKQIILQSTLFIIVKGDYGSVNYSALVNAFSEMGFIVQEGNSRYTVEAVIDANDSVYKFKTKETHSIYPSIGLAIKNQAGKQVYTFSYKTGEKTSNFTLENAQQEGYPKFATEIKNALSSDFKVKIGIDDLDLLFNESGL